MTYTNAGATRILPGRSFFGHLGDRLLKADFGLSHEARRFAYNTLST
jgi:hypothetical protein